MSEPASQPPATPAPPKTKPLSRTSITLNVMVQLLLLLTLFGIANYLSYRHYGRKDLSVSQDFTLSDATENYLKKLQKEVEITVIFTRESEMMQEVRSLVEEYRRARKSRIRTSEVDPTLDVERAQELKLKHGLTLKGNGVLITSNNRARFIPEQELIIRGLTGDRDNPSVDFRGEQAITSAIVGLEEGAVRRFYYIVGKGDSTGSAGSPSYSSLVDLGKQQNFEVQPLNLTDVQEIPTDANGIVLVGPKYDLSERELEMLEEYWPKKRASMLILLDPNGDTPRLRQFIAENGVTPRTDRVLYAESTSSGPRKEFSVQTVFQHDSEVSGPFVSVASSFNGQTQSLELKADSPELRARQIEVRPLINAAERYWGETRFLMDLPSVDAADAKAPIHVAASIELGHVKDERILVDSSRMVVVGNALLLDPQLRVPVHQDFVAAALNWMLKRERLIGITPKPKQIFRLQLTEDQRKKTFWVTGMLLPGGVLALGFVVWAFRRA